jgi:voltage-gated potassium channel Kch
VARTAYSYAPEVPNDPIDDIETTVDFVSGEIEEMADDLGEVGQRIYSVLRQDLLSRDGYLIVLVMVLLTIIVIPIDDDFTGGQVVTAGMLALLVLTTLSRSHVSHSLRVIGAVITGGTVLAAVLVLLSGKSAVIGTAHPQPKWLFALVAGSYTLVLALCFPAILRRAFLHRKVSLNTVAASLAAYLLLGLIFASAYRFINVLNPPFFNQSHINGFTYVYFSYITLTTVGYGDFVAANDAGRAVAILEAIFGQVFLVTIVAMVVSNLGVERDPGTRLRAARAPDHDGGPSDGAPEPAQ